MQLNQITLPVKNIKECVQFYLTLGLTQIVDSPHYARFVCQQSNNTFSIIHDDSDYKNGAVVYFEEENLDKWVEELQKKGLAFEQLPQDESYLWREAVLKDPSGNKIKLYWAGDNRLNPPWRVTIQTGEKT